ncbi:MAG TPA: tripartite tricarboxylate transporter substrate-binding protein [Burkholderiales bacterium]|nr:tripartite tricarboxylate transporter substrate-binding protein [Burkholderiales bacterium]
MVPVPPGGSNDILSRITAQTMSTSLGQSVVIDNRAGAAGMIGADNVAKSAPDGYSILNIQASFVANPAMRTKMPYDTLNDFAFVGMMARSPRRGPDKLTTARQASAATRSWLRNCFAEWPASTSCTCRTKA